MSTLTNSLPESLLTPVAPVLPASPAPRKAPHLPHLDGLRGVAALYVVLFHCELLLSVLVGKPHAMPNWVNNSLELFRNGHTAVCVFIVLSGYVMTLPLVFSGSKQLRGGVVNFFKRRSQRILPPYYAALFIFSSFIFFIQHRHINSTFATEMRPRDFWEHLFLIHNFDPKGWGQIDGPMWSLATEWQIYFVFALLLIPIWQRFGMGWVLLTASCLALGPHYLLPSGSNGDTASPWFLILFVFGMLSAQWSYENVSWRERVPWGWVALFLAGVWLLVAYPPFEISPQEVASLAWVRDILSGAATATILVRCARIVQQKEKNGTGGGILLTILQSRVATAMGAFSYSLYLFHQPILDLSIQLLRLQRWHLSATVIWFAVPLALPIIFAISYVFYLCFERPFINSLPKAPRRTAC